MCFVPKPSRDSSLGPCKHSRCPDAAAATIAAAAAAVAADGFAVAFAAAAAAVEVAAAAVGAAAAIDWLHCRHCSKITHQHAKNYKN